MFKSVVQKAMKQAVNDARKTKRATSHTLTPLRTKKQIKQKIAEL